MSRLLEDRTPLGRNEIRSAIGSKAEHVDADITALVHDEHVALEREGQKKLHRLLSPYRDPGPTESQPGPGPGEVTGSHRVPPSVGGDSEPDPVPTPEALDQPGPDDAQAELDRLTAKFGEERP